MSIRSDRLKEELVCLKKDGGLCSGIDVDEITRHGNVQWTVVFEGEKGTPFEGLRFEARVHFPDDYPAKSPRLHFNRDIFHPYVCPVTGLFSSDFKWTVDMSSVASFLTSAYKALNNPLEHQNTVFNPHAYRLLVADKQVYRNLVEGHLKDVDTILIDD